MRRDREREPHLTYIPELYRLIREPSERRASRVEGRGSRVEGRGRGVEERATRVEGICILGAGLWSLDARHSLRPIIHLPDLEIRVLLTANLMPPPIHVMRERPRPHLTEAIQLRYPFHPNYNIPIRHFLTELTELQNFWATSLNKLLLRNTIPFALGFDIRDFVKNPANCLRIHQRTSLLQKVLGFPHRDFFRSRRARNSATFSPCGTFFLQTEISCSQWHFFSGHRSPVHFAVPLLGFFRG